MKRKILIFIGLNIFSFCLFSQSKRTLKVTSPRMNGSDVIYIQNKLIEMGFSEIGEIDGYYGPKTEEAIKEFQELVGIKSSGIVSQKEYDFFESKTSDLIMSGILNYKKINYPLIISGGKNYKMTGYRTGKLFNISELNEIPSYCFSIVDDFSSQEFLILKVSENAYYIVYSETNDSYSFRNSKLFYENELYELVDCKLQKTEDNNIVDLITQCENLF